MIAPHRKAAQRPDKIQHLIGAGAVADRIAQVPESIPLPRRGIEHRAQRLKVGVDIGEDQGAHSARIDDRSSGKTHESLSLADNIGEFAKSRPNASNIDIQSYLYIRERKNMQVSRWGNSLALRLPAAIVEALDLKEGDQIEVCIAGDREFEVG